MMAPIKGKGLSLVFADVTPDIEDEYNRWYNEEHMPERVGVKGILSVARYEAIRGGPKYIAAMELETADVVSQPHFQELVKNSSEWTKKVTGHPGTKFTRMIYELIHPVELSPEAAASEMAPILQIGRMDVPEEIEDEFNEWYNTVFVPDFEKVEGCRRARRFRAVLGQPKYSVVYEFDHEGVSQTPEWAATRDGNPWSAKIRPQMTHAEGSPGVYRKIRQF